MSQKMQTNERRDAPLATREYKATSESDTMQQFSHLVCDDLAHESWLSDSLNRYLARERSIYRIMIPFNALRGIHFRTQLLQASAYFFIPQ